VYAPPSHRGGRYRPAALRFRRPVRLARYGLAAAALLPAALCLAGLLLLGGPRLCRAGEFPPELFRPAGQGREIGRPDLTFASGDTIEIVGHRSDLLGRQWKLPPPAYLQEPLLPGPRPLASFILAHPRTFEQPHYARVILGAGRFAGGAATLSGLGLVGGLWGQKTAGAIMGAGAILGALWGGTWGSESSSIRIGVEPGSYPPGSEPRSPRPPDARR
jgi:hypothetical protein